MFSLHPLLFLIIAYPFYIYWWVFSFSIRFQNTYSITFKIKLYIIALIEFAIIDSIIYVSIDSDIDLLLLIILFFLYRVLWTYIAVDNVLCFIRDSNYSSIVEIYELIRNINERQQDNKGNENKQ